MLYEELLDQIAQRDDRLVIMTAENRGPMRNLPAKLGKRFVDVGICEQTMLGEAAGLALRGRRPVVHALATFLTMRAFEFIRTDVGLGSLPVMLMGTIAGFLSEANGPTHQALEDISLLRGIPGMQIFCPADNEELIAGFPHFYESGRPTYVRFYAGAPVVPQHTPFRPGKAEVLATGNDITLLAYGFLVKEALAAKELLTAQGLSVGLINLRTLSPFDEDTVLQAAHNSRLLVTIEDHFLTGGLFSIVSELYAKRLTGVIPHTSACARIASLALENKWFKPTLLDQVLEYEGFNGTRIAQRVQVEWQKLVH